MGQGAASTPEPLNVTPEWAFSGQSMVRIDVSRPWRVPFASPTLLAAHLAADASASQIIIIPPRRLLDHDGGREAATALMLPAPRTTRSTMHMTRTAARLGGWHALNWTGPRWNWTQ